MYKLTYKLILFLYFSVFTLKSNRRRAKPKLFVYKGARGNEMKDTLPEKKDSSLKEIFIVN